MPKYLINLYQVSPKQNTIETNFIYKDDFECHNAYIDINDFFKNPDKTYNILSGGILGDN
jgi:beta-galactosidase beta subunit